MKQSKTDLIIAAAGAVLLAMGLFFVKALAPPPALPYVLIGLGCGIFGHGAGAILSRRTMKDNPALQKQREIDQNDERNAAIASRAKAKAYDMMTFVFGALMVAFALMGVEMPAVLLFVFGYLFVQGCGIYYRFKYEKEM